MEFVVNPDGRQEGGPEGRRLGRAHRTSTRATQGVVNVSDQVPPGLVSAIFGWQGPSDTNPNGDPQFYANNLVAGGAGDQQVSNGAFFKNTRGALRKLKRAPRTAKNTPGLSEKERYGHVTAAGRRRQPEVEGQELRLRRRCRDRSPAPPSPAPRLRRRGPAARRHAAAGHESVFIVR